MKLNAILDLLFRRTHERAEELKKEGKALPQGTLPRIRLHAGTLIECRDRNYVVGPDGSWRNETPKLRPPTPAQRHYRRMVVALKRKGVLQPLAA